MIGCDNAIQYGERLPYRRRPLLSCPMVLVTCARQRRGTSAEHANASISTARIPLLRAASIAPRASRKVVAIHCNDAIAFKPIMAARSAEERMRADATMKLALLWPRDAP